MNNHYITISLDNNSICNEYAVDSRRKISDLLTELNININSNYILSGKQNRQINLKKTFIDESVFTGDLLIIREED